MTADAPWTARIDVLRSSPAEADRLYRALRPEAEREVPRVHARLHPPEGRSVRFEVSANETGALRAALNTFLGWVDLAIAAEAVSGPCGPASPPAPEGVI